MATEKLRFLLETVGAGGVVKDLDKIGQGAQKNLGGKLGEGLGKLAVAGPAAAGAVVTVGVALKGAADKFKDLALASEAFSKSTGTSLEDASRWIEVTGDLGVSTDALESALGKMNKTLGASPEKFKAYGVEVARLNNGSVDVNKTFLNLVDRLNRIPDAAERARVASELLGKGWQGISTLIADGSKDLTKRLNEVSSAKVINRDELQKAKQYRDAMDDLNDAFEDIAITVGESMTPAIAEAAKELASFKGLLEGLGKGLSSEIKVRKFFLSLTPIAIAADNMQNLKTAATSVVPGMHTVGALLEDTADSAGGLTSAWSAMMNQVERIKPTARAASVGVETLADAQADIANQTNAARRASERHKDALRAEADAINDLTDAVNRSLGIQVSLEEAQDQASDSIIAYFDAVKNGKKEPEALSDQLRQSKSDMLDLATAAGAAAVSGLGPMATETEKANAKLHAQVTALQDVANMLGPNDPLRRFLAAYIAQLNSIPARKNTNLTLTTYGGVAGTGFTKGGDAIGVSGRRAAGGPVAAGGAYIVGEHGPEVLQMGSRGGNVVPNSGLGNTYNIYVQGYDDGRRIVEALKRYERTAGSRWRS